MRTRELRKYLHTPMSAAAEKRACPEGKELPIGWGISGATQPATSSGLGLHCGTQRLMMPYMTKTAIIVTNILSEFFLYSLFFILTP